MIPVDPSDERDAPMGGTFVRPGAVAWGRDGASGPYVSSEVIEQVLTTVAKDPERVSELLDELTRARLWLPLPEQRPVVKDAAVVLPTVEYLGSEFVPAFTSARRLTRWLSPESASAGLIPVQYTPGNEDGMAPHVVVAAADLARLLPGGVGIAVNPGAEVSVPVYAEDVAHLAAAHLMSGDVPIRLSHPPAEPKALLAHVRGGLCGLDAVRHASRAWLTVPGQGEGLVISVTLDDPASSVAHDAVVTVIERAAATVPDFADFPIDVTFPGESETDQIDEWVAANAAPFYVRPLPSARRPSALVTGGYSSAMTYSRFVRETTRPAVVPFVPEIVLRVAADPYELWEQTGQEALPFWGYPWAGGQGLARYLLDHPELAAGKSVLDVASGSGLVAIAAALAGAAHVLATDIDPRALAAIELNAAANRSVIETAALDMTNADGTGFDLVVAADVFYDRPVATTALRFLHRARDSGANVLVADPGRAFLPANAFTRVEAYSVPVLQSLEETDAKTVTVYRLRELANTDRSRPECA
jgi:predicted nicotinamide N-methyase